MSTWVRRSLPSHLRRLDVKYTHLLPFSNLWLLVNVEKCSWFSLWRFRSLIQLCSSRSCLDGVAVNGSVVACLFHHILAVSTSKTSIILVETLVIWKLKSENRCGSTRSSLLWDSNWERVHWPSDRSLMTLLLITCYLFILSWCSSVINNTSIRTTSYSVGHV